MIKDKYYTIRVTYEQDEWLIFQSRSIALFKIEENYIDVLLNHKRKIENLIKKINNINITITIEEKNENLDIIKTSHFMFKHNKCLIYNHITKEESEKVINYNALEIIRKFMKDVIKEFKQNYMIKQEKQAV